VSITGCVSETYLYGDAAASLSDVAVLRGPNDVVLETIDGQEVPQPGFEGLTPVDGWETHLQPGKHEIIIYLNSAYHKTRTLLACDFAIGRRYEVTQRVRYLSRGRARWVAEIRPADNGQPVCKGVLVQEDSDAA
jgi:hypothetical protein